ncbi:hypothetical protein [Niallia endozanthoxylica]|uniref:Uncharacterized protein n=1 Tax=Niallia endozanthoxylica TaxID=2036016 RepID=A0A5J5HQD3_9BACI|nr:hypothetical protein [Niallia endozanthoxylica]KAA9023973.1 hypothetical protein F4V44_12645 [Niallia endozanthoxylica]
MESSIFAIYSHIAFSVFGIILGTLFTATIVAMKKYAWLSAMFVLVLSLVAKALIESFPLFKTVDWILPPVYKIIEHMLDGEIIMLKETLLFDISFVMIYIIAATGITMFLFKKKER